MVTTSFGPAGSWVSASAIALQTDNKIIIIGTGLINGKFQFAAERLWSEGTLDARFGKGGKSVIPFTTDYLSANAVAIQPDGKILIAGTTSLYNDPDIAVARLSINGQLDRSFDGDGKLVLTELAHRDQGNAVFVQADGEILVTGTTYSTFTQGLVARTLSDGERDKSHNRNGIIRFGNNAATYGALAHPDGDLTLAGSTSDSPVRPGPMAIFQVNEKALDQSFGNGGQSVGPLGNEPADLQDMAIQPDGKIIVAGTTGDSSSLHERGALARFDVNGRLDKTFGQGGKVTLSINSERTLFLTVAVQNGKIAVAGYVLRGFRYDIFVAQFDANGILDQTFGNGGIVLPDLPAGSALGSILIDSIGRVVVAGGGNEFLVLRYLANGSPDNSFGTAGVKTITFSGPAGASFVTLLPDSKLLLGGGVHLATTDLAMARLNSDGTLDGTFGQNGTTTVDFDGDQDYLHDAAVLPDGKIVTVGTSGNGSVFHTTLVRFNANGILDQTFGNNGRVVSPASDNLDEGQSIALQSDGKILVAAYAYRTFGSDFIVLRFNQDGSLDSSSFGKNGTVRVEFDGTGGKGRRIAVDAFGNIVLAGLAGGEFGVARLVGDKSARCVATVKRDLRMVPLPAGFENQS